MMKNRISVLFLIILFFPVFLLSAISFHDIDLSNDNRLLFKTEFEDQHTLYISALAGMSIQRSFQQLTVIPEKLRLIDDGRTILAINRFGAARIPTAGGLPVPLPVFPSFANGDIPQKGRIHELAASPDGRWILYIEPVSPAYGNLLLIEISSGTRRVVSERVELPASDFPARWSPDSRLFVYSKDNRLYYFPIVSGLSVLIDERLRMIGNGRINSILWDSQGDFHYLTGNTLYRVLNQELFTRTIYGDFLSIGAVAAVLPLDFDVNFDRYWIAPDNGSILINKNGKGLFIFLLDGNQNTARDMTVLPHISIPNGDGNINVMWSASAGSSAASVSSSQLTVIFSLKNEVMVRRFEISGREVRNLQSHNVPLSSNGTLSPDCSRAVFWGNNGLEIWDFTNWQLISRLSREPVFSCAWVNNNQFISGNSDYIEEITISSAGITSRRVCLSGADEFGFEAGSVSSAGSPRILARVGNNWFATDGRTPWVQTENAQLRQVSHSTEQFRVNLESQSSGYFKNVPMIRNLQSTASVSLVSNHSAGSVYSPVRQSQIALCFDLYDDDTGLFHVLDALNRYDIKATFFLNGDFIRRNPLSAAAIAEAGHETASLFYAPIDLSDSRYRITREFITHGLARNEDEFFQVSGKELSKIWHPPFYRSSSLVNSAAAAAGYITITDTIDPGDWLSREDSIRLNMRQIPASEMIEQILGKKEDNILAAKLPVIIPIRLGQLPGGRDEYLFQRIDVLLDALIRSGCDIVPVSTVISR